MQACIDAAQGNKDFADSVSSFYGIIAIWSDGEDTWGGQPGVSFGSQVIGSVSNPATVSISNTGGMELTVNSVTASSEFKLALAPSTTGLRSGQLVITSNSNNVPGTQTSIALTGTGVEPHLDVAPNSISFAAPGRQVITLTSNGSMSVAYENRARIHCSM